MQAALEPLEHLPIARRPRGEQPEDDARDRRRATPDSNVQTHSTSAGNTYQSGSRTPGAAQQERATSAAECAIQASSIDPDFAE